MRISLLTILVLSSLSTLSVAHNDEFQAKESSNLPKLSEVVTGNPDGSIIYTVEQNVTPLPTIGLSAQGTSRASKPASENREAASFFQMLFNIVTDPLGIGEFIGDVDLTGTV